MEYDLLSLFAMPSPEPYKGKAHIKKAPSTWNKNHKTQFTMVNGKVPGEVESH